jgi:hypothetical protein
MARFTIAFACGVLALLSAAAAARANGDQTNFRSELRSVRPGVPGLQLLVVAGDDALELRNETGSTVLVPGYEGEPYLRVISGGRVEVNVNSPARYLNADRFAQTDVPRSASPDAPPKWEVIGSDGVVAWHDHRIHWMSKEALPPQVEDEDEDAKIFDWKVPLTVGERKVVASGTLFWDPPGGDAEEGSLPVAVVGGAVVAVLLLGGGATFILLRRRRKPAEAPSEDAW